MKELKLFLAPKSLENLKLITEKRPKLGINIISETKEGPFTDVVVSIDNMQDTLILLLMNMKTFK